jgi:hypothetical protein
MVIIAACVLSARYRPATSANCKDGADGRNFQAADGKSGSEGLRAVLGAIRADRGRAGISPS